ncbi:MAG: hypothetical protein CVU84_06545 [Firmicutes bacterium HGW-Firmicutes-1]|jgi:hypothetical protein|nr:MAG: hypothetical protein CVU84_06545 [Firmicutes bacterium HGW-Firmicutes-1]
MGKIKSIVEAILYVIVVLLCQKIIYLGYSFVIFQLAKKENGIVSKMLISNTLSIEEKALKMIDSTQIIYIFIGWIMGIVMIMLAFKIANQQLCPWIKNKIGLANVLFSVIIGFGLVLLINGVILGASEYINLEPYYKSYNSLYKSGFISTIVIVGICIPFFEELIFRGFIMGKLAETWSIWFSIVIQGLLFSIIHFDLIQGISVLLLGIIAGYVVMKTKTLYSGIVIHVVFNLTNLYLYKTDNNYYDVGQLMIIILLGFMLIYFGLDKLKGRSQAL